jgi:hypothetical protein
MLGPVRLSKPNFTARYTTPDNVASMCFVFDAKTSNPCPCKAFTDVAAVGPRWGLEGHYKFVASGRCAPVPRELQFIQLGLCKGSRDAAHSVRRYPELR